MRAIHEIDAEGSGLRALEVSILSTHVEEDLLRSDHPTHIDPLRWDPMIMKFTEYFTGGRLAYPSSLAGGWGMPPVGAAADGAERTEARRAAPTKIADSAQSPLR